MSEHATIGQGSTEIEWCTKTWNPVHGCSKVSPGCAHCYAEALSLRFGHTRAPWTPANAPANVQLKPDRLDQPLRWREPQIVFVNSMSDLFHEEVPDEYIARVFAVMLLAREHTFQVLTKRPERMQALLSSDDFWSEAVNTSLERDHQVDSNDYLDTLFHRLDNVWLGVSIENRRFVHRADLLRETPAAVRFISAEPLLGPLVKEAATTPFTPRVERSAFGGVTCRNCGRPMDTWQWQCAYADCSRDRWPDGHRGPELDLAGIDWLIAGGESGPGHRPIREEWVRDLRDACLATGRVVTSTTAGRDDGSFGPPAVSRGTAFFFKQWGGRTPKAGGRLLDGRTWDEMPALAGHPGSSIPTPEEG